MIFKLIENFCNIFYREYFEEHQNTFHPNVYTSLEAVSLGFELSTKSSRHQNSLSHGGKEGLQDACWLFKFTTFNTQTLLNENQKFHACLTEQNLHCK